MINIININEKIKDIRMLSDRLISELMTILKMNIN